MASKVYQSIRVRQEKHEFLLTRLDAGLLTRISYASVRGETTEEGAVQRVLNPRRIRRLKDFALAGGDYPSCVVLNWQNAVQKLEETSEGLIVPDIPRSAQIIDGQHRIAGLREAIKERQTIAEVEIPVALYLDLETRACADIFLSINTEQKPVPRSLVFDLYNVSSEYLVDSAASRANDIATDLNETKGSPYYQLIKYPGSPRVKGGIALSTAVTAIKPLVEEKGVLELSGIRELERQSTVILNFFSAIQAKYGSHWDDRSNAFLYAAGFVGSVDFFRQKIVDYCRLKKSFTIETIAATLNLAENSLILQAEVKGIGGKDAPKKIYDRLLECFSPEEEEADIEI